MNWADWPSELAFTGDTLFKQSIGRTDLPGGSGRDLLGSILTKLLVLDDDTVATLHERIKVAERDLLLSTTHQLATSTWHVRNRKVHWDS